MKELFDWPGKSDADKNEHPAVLHMLDVAACAEHLISGHTAFAKLSEAQQRALVILVALHDVGKISESFRALIRDGMKGAPRHWQLSDFLLYQELDNELKKLGSVYSAREKLYAAVSGHHGKPPTRGNKFDKNKQRRAIGCGINHAKKWVSELLRLFPEASLEGIAQEQASILSWPLCGLTVAADWIGSNTEWFPFESRILEFDRALMQSRKRAEVAVKATGLLAPEPNNSRAEQLLALGKLRPMQQVTADVEIGEGPQLIILEDATGSGKTEAALTLAHRMILKRKARGIYFALPTMATSNAMYERMKNYAPRLFSTKPSMALAHSRAKLTTTCSINGTDNDKTPEGENPIWLTDNRRKTLLANVGVGTIDQALLGILPTRFATLRLFALADKIVIIDEAHSYDPYTQKQLETLLKMQAMLGGSAIVMTATLPLTNRQAYADSFQEGLGETMKKINNTSYPALHKINRTIETHTVKALQESYRKIPIKHLKNSDDAVNVLKDAAERGAACVWIRNAVDDAIESADSLSRMGLSVNLLHARFCMEDRLRKEGFIENIFGKKGSNRRGQILVATQVIEASLDLDFDVMVTDLAPIGSIIQRLGRLWRHRNLRPDNTRPNKHPTLHLLSPDPTKIENENWLRDVIGRGAYVYRIDHQWRTADTLLEAQEIIEPEGVRLLIEAVHGENARQVPEEINKLASQAEGEAHAERGLAGSNVIAPEEGYLSGSKEAVASDEYFPTRLGEQQITLVLARKKGNELVPWASGEDLSFAWEMSEISVNRRRFESMLPGQDEKRIQALKNTWPEWKREKHVCILNELSGIEDCKLHYDPDKGLFFKNMP